MKPIHTLPIPPEIIDRACTAVRTEAGSLPFVRNGIGIDRDLIGAAMEELNAEPNRTLAIRARTGTSGKVIIDGLDRHLASRGYDRADISDGIARILVESAICRKAPVPDRRSRKFRTGIRLLPAWTWAVVQGESATVQGRELIIPGTTSGASWTTVCPVCREGRLNPSEGRLFGVPETDFFVCSLCGARFAADAGKYRLIAVVHKRDPEWGRLLNQKLSSDEWLAIAQGRAVTAGRAEITRGRSGKERPLPPTPPEKMAIEAGRKTFYFSRVELDFGRGTVHDLFTKRKDALRKVLALPEYSDCAGFAARYRQYLDAPVGFFLDELRNRHDLSYRHFLHPCGDERHCTFRIAGTGLPGTRGVYIIVQEGSVRYCGASLRSFTDTIEKELGRLSPGSCYRDGRPGDCLANTLICQNRKSGGGLYVCPLEDAGEIQTLVQMIGSGIRNPLP